MNKIRVDLGTPNPLQQRVTDEFRAGKRIVAMISGRQGGKTHYGARWLLAQIASATESGGLYLIASPSYRMARVAQRSLEQALQSDLKLWRSIKHLKQPIPTYTFPNGAVIEVHSIDDPDSIRGLTAKAVWFDEAAVAASEAYDILLPVLLAEHGTLLLTTTPRGKQNWLYQKIYLKSCGPDHPDYDPDQYHAAYAVVFGTTWDNVENLSEEAVKQLEEQYGKGSRFERQEIGGEFVSYDGLVFNWDEENFVPRKEIPERKEFQHIIGGLDFGWRDPTAAVVLGYKDGVWHAIDGVYESEMDTNTLAQQLAVLGEQYGVAIWYADSAEPGIIHDLHSRGLPVFAVKKPTIEDSIRMLSTFTNRNRLKVSYSCHWLRDELQSYQYADVGRRGNQNPLDRNNHAIDAIRYATWEYRWLWANKVDYTYKLPEHRSEFDDLPLDVKDIIRRRRRVNSTQVTSYAGLADR